MPDKPRNIMDAIRKHLKTYPRIQELLGEKYDIAVDNLEEAPDFVGIYSAGDRAIKRYFDGSIIIRRAFYIQLVLNGVNDIVRLDNSGVVDDLQSWMMRTSLNDGFALPKGCEFDSAEIGEGMPVDYTENGQGIIYRITGNLTYEKEL